MLKDEGSSSGAISDSLQAQQRNPADTTQFTFDLIGSDEELRVVSFTGIESVSEVFIYNVIIASRNDLLSAEQFMGKSALLTLVDYEQNELVHGEIARFSQVSEQGDYLLYELLMVPRFWFLKKRHNYRIFQNFSVIQIIEQVLSGAGIRSDHYALKLSQNYSAKSYCVQYEESEFDFLSRLMEEDGLHYHFEHQPDRHLMVIADHPAAFTDIQGSPQLPYHPKDDLNQAFENIYEFRFKFQTRYGTASTRDYSFKKPLNPIQEKQHSMDSHLEDYSYPGNCQDSSDAQIKTRIKLQQHQHKLEQGFAKSNCRHLRAGKYYQLYDNPARQYNQQYLLLYVEHRGEQPQSLDEYGAGAASQYYNKSRCIPSKTPYKTPLRHKKSIISGYQSSTVTGPSGEEIYTNEHAQSKVQFPWDREAQQDENSSCWLRAAQTWAGKNWGSLILPRMGQETKVGYIHGDPDQPVITGRLYNERHKPPYALPEHKTRSTFKTSSTLGGNGYNEIRIDDRKNQEQLYFHAQKDLDIRAKNDRRDIINHDRHLIVDNNRYEHIKDNSHHSIAHNQNEKTGQDHSISIGQTQHCQAGQAILTEVTQSIHFKAGKKIILEAGVELTIKAGGGFIKIDPSGITAQGTAINFNSGTGASSAKIAKPQQPSIAVEADRDKPGQLFKPTVPQAVKAAEEIGFKGEISRLLQAGNDNEQGICIPCLLAEQAKQQIVSSVLPNLINTHSPDPLDPLPLEPLTQVKEKYWLELEHRTSFPDDNHQTEPAKGANYRLTLPTGREITGQLDDNGTAQYKQMPSGVYKVEYEPYIDAEITAKQNDIQQVLDSILRAERKESAAIEKKLQDARFYGFHFPGSNALAQAELYKKAAADGIWNGLTGLANFAWTLLKGAGSLMYELALRSNPITAPEQFREDLKALKADHKELQQFVDEDLEIYAALLSDEKTHDQFKQFSVDYLSAQHSLEYTETGGQVAFDILLTIFTAGVGAADGSRHLAKLKKLKALLNEMKVLLKRKWMKAESRGTHNSRIKTTIPLRNPHQGLHNRDDLTPDLTTSANSFKTARKVDMRNLSEKDEITEKALINQGWKDNKIKQVLESGDDFTSKSYEVGDKMYGFNTAGRGRALDNSAYLLDEKAYQNVLKEYYKQGHWDKEGIKDYLALPCFNEASQIDVMEVTKPAIGVQSTIGKAAELIRYQGADDYTTGTLGKIMGGGGTQTTIDPSALKILTGQ